MKRYDLLIVGAGPGGMAAAVTARRHGLAVLVLDEQPAPGGQIWRSVETAGRRDAILGPSYSEGRAIAESFRSSGADYIANAKLWQLDPGFRAYFTHDDRAESVEAAAVILATGAQERPVPFPGWTLPGVMTVGAAQILLKNAGQVPTGPTWIAGSGPLPLLYAVQILRAGGRIAGFLDTTPAGQWRSSLRHLPRALRVVGDLIKGLEWQAELRRSRTPVTRHVIDIEAVGDGHIETVRYRTAQGATQTVEARTLLVHEGVIPHIHPALSLDCETLWDDAQECFRPVIDDWGESSLAGLFIAGDGAGIAGAKAALHRGELAALRVAERTGRADTDVLLARARASRRKLERELAIRPFLDALYRPRPEVFAPADETIVCRCEEVTARDVRAIAGIGRPGPNQVKTATRTGMGPCQGRQCGYTVTRLIAAAQSRTPAEVGFFHVRPPLKPLTLGEMASLDRVET